MQQTEAMGGWAWSLRRFGESRADTARLTVCLRACVERLPLPPFGDREDRLTVGVQVSLEPRWAMLRTVPKLELE